MARRKKQITYDSKETLTLIGLVSLAASILIFVSFLSNQADPTSFTGIIRRLFNTASPIVSIYLIVLSFRLFGVKNKFTKTSSLVAQFFLTLSFVAIYTANSAKSFALLEMDSGETGGGIVGAYIVRQILGNTIPTAPITVWILWVIAIFILPFALSLTAKQTVGVFAYIFRGLGKFVYSIFNIFERVEDDSDSKSSKEILLNTKMQPELSGASKFGDFNEILKKRREENSQLQKSNSNLDAQSNQQQQKELLESANLNIKKNLNNSKSENAEIVEKEIGEDGLQQQELLYPNWKFPPISLLTPFTKTKSKEASIKQNAEIIEQILTSFNIEATVEDAYIGPSVVQYALNIPLGVNVKKITSLSENIALALGVDSQAVRIESIPETTFLGVEIPRTQRDMIRFKEIMSSGTMEGSKMHLPVPVGKDISGEYILMDLTKMPHLLIAGATGSGKSVVTNAFITSLMMKKTPDEVKFILVDPKQVELMDYDETPYLLTPVITDMDKVVNALKWAVLEMETRYTNLAKNKVRNIEQFNEKHGFAAMPYIVIVIDEMADMMMTASRNDAENAIVRIAQKARAVGIHLILATQRPSVNVITGIIKANIPGRIGMSVTSSTDSRVILDRVGAESLMGRGDLLYKAPDSVKVSRLQGPFIDQQEIIRVVDFIKNQAPEVTYISDVVAKKTDDSAGGEDSFGDISGDNLIEQAIRLVAQTKKGSASYLQRRLSIGFNRAARLLDELEEAGVVGPQIGSKPREVLIDNADSFIAQLKGEY